MKKADNKIRVKIERLTDGEFIDLLDKIMGITRGLTATEWLEYEYMNGEDLVKQVIDELEGSEDDIIETYSTTR